MLLGFFCGVKNGLFVHEWVGGGGIVLSVINFKVASFYILRIESLLKNLILWLMAREFLV
jgi:hypothetical protein